MKVCILGWYGTETLGDRAILDGIIKIFTKTYQVDTFFVGSIFPFFTERTLFEDKDIYCNLNDCSICIFSEKTPAELKKYIRQSDFVIMGGGPIMDINDLYMIRKGFKIAQKNKIPTALIGCGYGPFHNRRLNNVAKDILKLSDLCVFRDEISRKRAIEDIPQIKAFHLCDPAIISILHYKQNKEHRAHQSNYIAINYRYVDSYLYPNNKNNLKALVDLVEQAALNFDEVRLVPMHTFFYGGDDREFFSELFFSKHMRNLSIQYCPQNLYELYDTFFDARACVGMRYHSVVIQTLLNGNNVILDYTEPHKGKISGFLESLGFPEFYNDRYINITESEIHSNELICLLKKDEKYELQDNRNDIKIYSEVLRGCYGRER